MYTRQPTIATLGRHVCFSKDMHLQLNEDIYLHLKKPRRTTLKECMYKQQGITKRRIYPYEEAHIEGYIHLFMPSIVV